MDLIPRGSKEKKKGKRALSGAQRERGKLHPFALSPLPRGGKKRGGKNG